MTMIDRVHSDATTPDPAVRYRAIQVEAVLALIAGVCSVGMFFNWLFIFCPLAAVVFGYRSLQAIERTPEEFTGAQLAKTGVTLGIVFWLLGSLTLLILGSEVPHGYQVLDYAELEPSVTNKGEFIPLKIQELSANRTKVYIKGYILPGHRQVGLKEFSICRTSDMCRFGVPNTKKRELIRVKLTGDLLMNYTDQIIGVGGYFHADQEDPNGMPYSIEADYVYH